MRTAVFALVLLALQQKDPDETRITIKVTDTPIEKLIDMISRDSGVPIEWSADAKKKVDRKATANLEVQDMPVTGAVKLVVLPQGLEAKAVDKKKVVIVVP
jgi:hypothetical protein